MKCSSCGAGLPDGCETCPPKTINCYSCGNPVTIGGSARILDDVDVRVSR